VPAAAHGVIEYLQHRRGFKTLNIPEAGPGSGRIVSQHDGSQKDDIKVTKVDDRHGNCVIDVGCFGMMFIVSLFVLYFCLPEGVDPLFYHPCEAFDDGYREDAEFYCSKIAITLWLRFWKLALGSLGG